MNALQKSQRILLGLAIGVLLALLIAPETGWIARSQIGGTLLLSHMNFGIGLKDQPRPMSTYKAIAQAHPNDFPIQFAYAEMSALAPRISVVNNVMTDDPQLDALQGLTARFGDSPSLYANILRISTRGVVSTGDRPEGYLIEGQTPPPPPPPATPYNTSVRSSDAVLAEFDQDAAAGERLDPNNAYFPFMRAYGLFAANKDDAAIAAILRAGHKTEWKEYYLDQVTGEWEMNEAVTGGKESLARLAIAAAILFPQYARLREAARIGAYKAMLMEQSGNVDQGLAIRFALMHCGSLMRVQSTSAIGSLVGIAISRTAMYRPDGAPYAFPGAPGSSTEIEQTRLDQFCAYLTQTGHSDDAAWVRAESVAGDQAKTMIRQGTTTDLFVMAPVRAGIWWCVDMFVLSCACWLLILGLAASLLSRTSQIQSGEPLPVPVRWGIGTAFIVLSLVIVVAAILSNLDKATISMSLTLLFVYSLVLMRAFSISKKFGLAMLVVIPLAAILTVVIGELLPALWLFVVSCEAAALVVLLIWLVVRGGRLKAPPSDWLSKSVAARKQEIQSGLKAFGITLAAFALVALVAYWQIHWLVDIASILSVLANEDAFTNVITTGIIVQIVVVAVLMLLPAGVMAIVGLVRKSPLSITLTQGYRNWAVPIASLLLIGYGGMVLATMSAEREGNYVLEQIARHEGTYYAQIAGQSWPGPVSEPDPAMAAR